ncbi:LEUCINE-RICH REPEAT RECEPTOR-LIKE PROTEIN KINASE FAMILY PROTEIN-RELATED [Salix purpurea]|uniref:LEUCINE-RICH REPEAT RECEPTOR-LIKE PROTEIN KINASE FAMILY PROTEIN-RELATED n=1 Tax=Salix purpurea TaxID=77065 RepID=A0A9Q0SPS9_SALPP|nr:LEUCINE-RICH REPEAT RECEPTOR-LIKE PROTEIN KINASE FAMILY PROTEIN-RELATED [Salix purpurea]
MMSSNAITIFLLFLNISIFPAISSLNQEGHCLLSWLSTFNSSLSATFFSTWDSSHKSPCKWDYVICSSNGFVSGITITSINLPTSFPTQLLSFNHLTTLVLSNANLTGEIPRSIGNLSSLSTLDLSFNSLTGGIPAEIGRLSQLKLLALNTNSLHEIGQLLALETFRAGGNPGIYGEIPMQISNCKELIFLGLADTGISGQIPSVLGELKHLETLSVYTSKLTGSIPADIGNCSAMENLYLYGNQISGRIPDELTFLTNLKRLLLWQNNLTGSIPDALGNCLALEEVLLSDNYLTGEIPPFVGNFFGLKQLELDNNRFTGEIPPAIGQLKELLILFAWQNQLQGSIPAELAKCEIPPDIGNCIGLIRLRLGSNNFTGQLPPEIGLLHRLSFLELSDNQFTGEIPPEIGNCTQLEMVDLHSNRLHGIIPTSVEFLVSLNVLDLSKNSIAGSVPENLGMLTSLNKLVISENYITGSIPKSLGLCRDLQLLEMSSNRLTGSIPDEIGRLQGLDILLNLSRNSLTGSIPESFANLSNLANLDLSHNMLTGTLTVLGSLDNLVSLNVSHNNFSGLLPDTKLFHDLPASAYAGNQELCINRNKCHMDGSGHGSNSTRNLVVCTLLSVTVTLLIVLLGGLLFIRIRGAASGRKDEEDNLEWDITPFQKLNFSVNDIVTKLSDSNVVGKGVSGMVYRVETPLKQVIAVKKLWPLKNGEIPERDLFSAEVRALGSIRHKNIVRLLGCCNNGKTRLLLFDYISKGSLAGLLHEKVFLDWDARYNIILGAAHGLAYLHHDCIPPIVHRDIKTNNILVGPQFEAFLADFGLAKLVDSEECSRVSNVVAGSYGYIAPEYGYCLRITEKSDVYSYGVVLLEVLTGKEPTDNRIPEGVHIVTWVSKALRERRTELTTILDPQLLLRSGTQLQEMLQVLGVALLCVNPSPEERPTMKDVTAMLKEIRHVNEDFEKPKYRGMEATSNPRAAVHSSSFSKSSEPLIRSPS